MIQKASTRALCKQLGLRNDLALIDQAWEAEAGGLSSMARIVALENASLLIEVNSSPAMHELTMRRKELIRRMNRYFSDPFLKDIQVKMAN